MILIFFSSDILLVLAFIVLMLVLGVGVVGSWIIEHLLLVSIVFFAVQFFVWLAGFSDIAGNSGHIVALICSLIHAVCVVAAMMMVYADLVEYLAGGTDSIGASLGALITFVLLFCVPEGIWLSAIAKSGPLVTLIITIVYAVYIFGVGHAGGGVLAVFQHARQIAAQL